MPPPDSAPTSIVRGVVHASGAGGVKFRGQADWTLTFSLEPWREEGGALRPERLRVHRGLSDAELKTQRQNIRPYDVLRLRVRFEAPLQAELMELLGPVHDEELAGRAAELQEPATIEDDVFGTLTLDRRLECHQADAVWMGRRVELLLDPEGGTLAEVLEAAKALWRDQAGWDRRIRDRALRQLLPLKNGRWLGDGEAEVTAGEFERRMTLESVTVHADGAFRFYHADGDLFRGHAIEVSGTVAEGPTDADIPG